MDYTRLTKDGSIPVIGIAFSGGGYRSLLTGAGALAAIDGRQHDTSCLQGLLSTNLDLDREDDEDDEGEDISMAYVPNNDKEPHKAAQDEIAPTKARGLEGILQAVSYVSGLSGGSWLIGSFLLNNMVSVFHLAACSSLWDFQMNLAIGDHLDMRQLILSDFNFSSVDDLYPSRKRPQGMAYHYKTETVRRTAEAQQFVEYHERIMEEVSKKRQAGFAISLTDYWARALSRKLLDIRGDPGITWSDITTTGTFIKHEAPFPIAIALVHDPRLAIHSSHSTIIEFTPYEFGSWDRKVGAFSDIQYLGTDMIDWEPVNDKCVRGYDNASFIMATSSSLFNDLLLLAIRHTNGLSQKVLSKFRKLLDGIPGPLYNREYALYKNPFYSPPKPLSHLTHTSANVNINGEMKDQKNQQIELTEKSSDRAAFNRETLNKYSESFNNPFKNSKLLLLGDGGQDGQNLPLDPLLRPERKLDIIFAIDASSDVHNYPNGTALRRPVGRYHSQDDYMRVPYPEIPPEEVLVELNPNNEPKFFGCSLDSYPTWDPQSETLPPLIVYVPNRQYTFNSNTSTTKLTYSRQESFAMVENGYYLMSNPFAKNWPKCVGCAIVSRGMYRNGIEPPSYCEKCFRKYCIN
ncbi:Plb2p [Sugiyamaella lignohabitans]|uniref:Lysophospholipase n=1 Tax=Sugiyamaella lignohabitans TaxID=796027 RepID=A0A167CJC0_9ASCO|nr:Plb2p [Sugiyamaella lignohabitans]ANB11774.1 Plb2p [Sugiyamaella lignohabitans]